jgi:hypothetical protein
MPSRTTSSLRTLGDGGYRRAQGNQAFGEPHRTILTVRKMYPCQRGSRHGSPWLM